MCVVMDEASSQLTDAFPDRPMIRAELLQTIGKTYSALGLLNKTLITGLRMRSAVHGPGSEQVAEAQMELGLCLSKLERPQEALVMLGDAWDVLVSYAGLSATLQDRCRDAYADALDGHGDSTAADRVRQGLPAR